MPGNSSKAPAGKPGKIVVLDEVTANQIAAGEVVERPASVVKELAENSIDAGATRITVELEDGGKKLIRVTDNGCGMEAEDARLCLERHATSKIRNAEDLFRISTLGFRGEALPSIASVSRFELVTRPHEGLVGYRVAVEGGEARSFEEVGCPPGTRVTVRDLFFNIPARAKYLKTTATEFGQACDALFRLALARPNVAFRLVNGGNEVAATPGSGQVLDALVALYGQELARELVALEYQDGAVRIRGYAGGPAISRAARTHQHFIVNGRFVRSQILRYPLEEAYRNLLTSGRHPVAVIYVDLDSSEVDVNVHPTKLEVRFSHEREVRAAVYRAVSQALKGARYIPGVESGGSVSREGPQQYQTQQGWSQQGWSLLGAEEAAAAYFTGAVTASPRPAGSGIGVQEAAQPDEAKPVGATKERTEGGGTEDRSESESGGSRCLYPELAALRPLGQLRQSYIVAEGPEGLYLIDQHAAHERIFYEQFSRTLGGTRFQSLILPIDLELTPRELAAWEEAKEVLAGEGFDCRPFGGGTLLVHAVPGALAGAQVGKFLKDFLDRAVSSDPEPGARREELRRAMAACKAAVKASDRLMPEEMRSLLDQLSRCRAPYTCPHGRPTVISLGIPEIEKRFKRA